MVDKVFCMCALAVFFSPIPLHITTMMAPFIQAAAAAAAAAIGRPF